MTSSTGVQTKKSVEENTLPLAVFYGDPERVVYDQLGARYGISNTLLPGWRAVFENWKIVFDLVMLGALLGAQRQAMTNASAAWQQGCNVLLDQSGRVLYLHRVKRILILILIFFFTINSQACTTHGLGPANRRYRKGSQRMCYPVHAA